MSPQGQKLGELDDFLSIGGEGEQQQSEVDDFLSVGQPPEKKLPEWMRATGAFLGGFVKGGVSTQTSTFLRGPASFGHQLLKAIAPSLALPDEEFQNLTLNQGAAALEKAAPNAPKGYEGGLAEQFGAGFGSGISYLLTGVESIPAAALQGALSNGASAYEDALEQGLDEGDASLAFWINAGVGTTEAAPIGDLLNRVAGGMGGKKLVARMLREALIQGGEEGLQETVQQITQNATLHRPLDEGVGLSAGIGATVGAVMGGGAAALHKPARDSGPPPGYPGTPPAETRDLTGKTPAQAEVDDFLSVLADTGEDEAAPELTPEAEEIMDPEGAAAAAAAEEVDEGELPHVTDEEMQEDEAEPVTPPAPAPAPAQPKKTTPKAEKPRAQPAASQAASGGALPRELAGAKPRYSYGPRQFELEFETDRDRALFITSQTNKSKRDADYRNWLRSQGLTDEDIDAYGAIVRAKIKNQAKAAAGDVKKLRIAQEKRAEPTPEPTIPTEADLEREFREKHQGKLPAEPPAPRTAAEVQRETGLGYPEAAEVAERERAAAPQEQEQAAVSPDEGKEGTGTTSTPSPETAAPTSSDWLAESIARPEMREGLAWVMQEAGQADRGGLLVIDPLTGKKSRTHWAARQPWWSTRPVSIGEKEFRHVVQKALDKGIDSLTARQRESLEWAVAVAEHHGGVRPAQTQQQQLSVPAEMPKGQQVGTDLNGDPVYAKQERGDIARPDAGIEKPKATQVGLYDEEGGLFEQQAAARDAGPQPTQEPTVLALTEGSVTLDDGREFPVAYVAIDISELGDSDEDMLREAEDTGAPPLVADDGFPLVGGKYLRHVRAAYGFEESAGRARNMMVEYAAQHGVDISGIAQPMIVRVLAPDVPRGTSSLQQPSGVLGMPGKKRMPGRSLGKQAAKSISPGPLFQVKGEVSTPEDTVPGSGTGKPADPLTEAKDEVVLGPELIGLTRPLAEPYAGGPINQGHVIEAALEILKAARSLAVMQVGRLKMKGAAGEFDVDPAIIRIRKKNAIAPALHEIGHALDAAVFASSAGPHRSPLVNVPMLQELQRLGRRLYGNKVDANKAATEGFAEFVRVRISQPALARRMAPKFADWFDSKFLMDHREIGEALDHATDLARVWREQGAFAREAATRVDPTSRPIRVANAKRGLRRFFSPKRWIDDALFLDAMDAWLKQDLKGELRGSVSPASILRSDRGLAEAMFDRFVNVHTLNAAQQVTGPSLREGLEPIRKGGLGNLFTAYLRARRARAEHKHNALKGRDYDPGLALEDAEHIINTIEREHPEVSVAATNFYDWWDRLNDYGAQLSPSYKALVEKFRADDAGDYVPQQRYFPEWDELWHRGGPAPRTGAALIKRLSTHGSAREVIDPFYVAMREGQRRMSSFHKRGVFEAMRRHVDKPGANDFIRRVQPKQYPAATVSLQTAFAKMRAEVEAKGGTVVLKPGGIDLAKETLTFFAPDYHISDTETIIPWHNPASNELELYWVNPEAYAALRGIEVFRLPPVLDFLTGIGRKAYAIGNTAARASWALIANPARDAQDFWMNTRSHKNAGELAISWFDGFRAVSLHYLSHGKAKTEWTPFIESWLDLGLGGGMRWSHEFDPAKRRVIELTGDRKARLVHKPIEFIQHAIEIMSSGEAVSRIVEARDIAERVGWKPGEPMTRDQQIAIRIASKQVTLDPTAGGDLSRAFNRVLPFFTSSIQGTTSNVRALQRDPRRFLLRGLATITVPTLLLWALNRDEEWWQDTPPDEKFRYWHVPYDFGGEKGVFRIPRAHAVAGAFASMFEAAFDAGYREQPKLVGEWAEQFARGVAPPLSVYDVPGFGEWLEQKENVDSYTGMPIVPRGQIDGPIEEQFNDHTTTAAIEIGRLFGMSPRRVDHAVRGIFGGAGGDFMALFGRGDTEVEYEFEESNLPVVGGLFRRGGQSGTRSVAIDEMYDLRHAAEAKSRSRFQQETPREQQIRLQLEDACKAVSALTYARSLTKERARRVALQQKAVEVAKSAIQATTGDRLNRPMFAGSRKQAEAIRKRVDQDVARGRREQ